MLDVGLFRIGGAEYAKEEGGVGLATLRREHVTVRRDRVVFDYPAKSGVARHHAMSDPAVVAVVRALRRRRGGPDELLAYREGRRWHGLDSEDINDYVKEHLGEEFSAKDFRTWNATVLAAVFTARRAREDESRRVSRTSRKRAMSAVAREVAAQLGNTPAVARRSYIDPRVFDRYLAGATIIEPLSTIESLEEAPDSKRRQIELAVLQLLADNLESPVVTVGAESAGGESSGGSAGSGPPEHRKAAPGRRRAA
jgi:DNA topoisomerase IB